MKFIEKRKTYTFFQNLYKYTLHSKISIVVYTVVRMFANQ